MQPRVWIILSVCLILAVVRISGVHAHLSLHHDETGAHDTHVAFVVAEHDFGHVDSHIKHGDIDVDGGAESLAKLSKVNLSAALIALVLLLIAAFPVSLWHSSAPASHPPKWRKRSYLIPPSQAPPRFA